MTGSQAPQRALRRLARLGLRTDRLAALTAPAALLDDPLAGLTARPLDESALEAVLQRLEGSATDTAATASSSAAARFRNESGVRKGRLARRASNALVSRPGTGGLPPAPGHEPLATRSSSHTRRIRPAAPTAHEPNGSSPAPAPAQAAVAGRRESSPLARAAGRVPGGAAAVSARVAAGWTPDVLAAAGVQDGPALLEAALARRIATGGRRRAVAACAVRAGRLVTSRPRGCPARVRRGPSKRAAGGDSPLPGAADACGTAEPAASGSGSGGLAELVRRWESVHGRDDEPPAARLEGEADAGGGIEAEEALARALERVLAAELRRSGIEVDAG